MITLKGNTTVELYTTDIKAIVYDKPGLDNNYEGTIFIYFNSHVIYIHYKNKQKAYNRDVQILKEEID